LPLQDPRQQQHRLQLQQQYLVREKRDVDLLVYHAPHLKKNTSPTLNTQKRTHLLQLSLRHFVQH
jgi:hypothetical protein